MTRLEQRVVPAGSPIIREASGFGTTAIQAAVDQFRADLGAPNNAALPAATVGRREINWDGIPDTKSVPNQLPPDYFNVTSPRGVVFSTPGTGFRVSAKTGNMSNLPTAFENIRPGYGTTFSTFSPERLFTAIGSNITEVTFFLPGTTTPAGVRGFGTVFTDVDTLGSTKLEFFDANGVLLITRNVLAVPGSGSLSFLGILCPADAPPIARVRITSGGGPLGGPDLTEDPGSGTDLVVMDDFLYSEPKPLPNAIFTGKVFHDGNRNGAIDRGEPGLPGVLVFLDANTNGMLDNGEVFSNSLSDGTYTLTAPTPTGTFAVRTTGKAGFALTGDPLAVQRVSPGRTFSDGDIGLRRPTNRLAVAADAGGGPAVQVYNPDGSRGSTFFAFDATFTGGVRVAVGDVNGDGTADYIVGTGPGSALLRVLDGADRQTELFRLLPFGDFTGGLFVAAGDVNGDGLADIAVSPDQGGGPRVRIFSGGTFTQLVDFFGIDDPDFRGGARVAFGDVNGDGAADLLVAAGFGGGPRLAGFSGVALAENRQEKLFSDFFVFEPTLRNGVFIAAGDIDGDGFADLIAGGGPGGGPRVFALSGQEAIHGRQTQLANFFAGNPNDRGGIRVAGVDLGDDLRGDILTGAGAGSGSKVATFPGVTIPIDGLPKIGFESEAFGSFAGGVFVG